MKRKYYSIRVVWAESEEEAIYEVIDQNFDEDQPLCDRVIDLEEALCLFNCERTMESLREL